MKKFWSLIGTLAGVVISVVIAWWLVTILFHLLWLIWKIIIVAIVAAVVFFALRALLFRGESKTE
ncbi:MAG: hypothetical protein IT191_08095 [Microbacteriaceae bacterium]|nr:hypothetical protein [Cryobacterium sp.]MCC6376965.1 hypothetical protein [Microbacteriaceae bacterium]